MRTSHGNEAFRIIAKPKNKFRRTAGIYFFALTIAYAANPAIKGIMSESTEKKSVPRVSVLLPVYNTREDHLREALESVLGQTYGDFEVLVVDDASTDENVGRVVRSYDDPRIRFSVNAKNLGISKTRNLLMEMARGEYLAVMDHDDIALPRRFEMEVAYLDAHPEVGVVSSQVEFFGDKTGVEPQPIEDADIRLGLVHACVLSHSATMIRKRVLTENSIWYEEEFSPAEDYALWCRLLPHTRFHNLPEVLVRYRFHAGNTSLTQKERIRRAHLAIVGFAEAENPALHNLYRELATHTTKVKLFGCIPFLKIVSKGRRSRCSVFGIPLYRSKRYSKLDA